MKNPILDFISLKNGEEHQQKVLEDVTSNISFRGSSIWILACAIVIACVGLNVNSTAVIIGAMLISPLMGPILGAGFALGTHDFSLLRRSLKNLLIATVVSLLIAVIYFSISPFKDVQSELLARTTPNIYDVMIAFFGGLVGVIAITRVEKGNPIPGVAIATALMPPLCTAGYGIAVGEYEYFFGAFYLYSINCFFICLATYLIVKYYLRYPLVQALNPKETKIIGYVISFLMTIMVVPSFYLAYNLLQEKKYSKKIENFIEVELLDKGYTIIYKRINYNRIPKTIELAFLNQDITEQDFEEMNRLLVKYNIDNTEIVLKQDLRDIEEDVISDLKFESNHLNQKDSIINNLNQELKQYKINDFQIKKEAMVLFPQIVDLSVGKHLTNFNTDSAYVKTVVVYKVKHTNTKQVKDNFSKDKLRDWLLVKLNVDKLILVEEKE
ncbi:MAG: DUF389 domain-containing protein [Cytophagaceae bacterium]